MQMQEIALTQSPTIKLASIYRCSAVVFFETENSAVFRLIISGNPEETSAQKIPKTLSTIWYIPRSVGERFLDK